MFHATCSKKRHLIHNQLHVVTNAGQMFRAVLYHQNTDIVSGFHRAPTGLQTVSSNLSWKTWAELQVTMRLTPCSFIPATMFLAPSENKVVPLITDPLPNADRTPSQPWMAEETSSGLYTSPFTTVTCRDRDWHAGTWCQTLCPTNQCWNRSYTLVQ